VPPRPGRLGASGGVLSLGNWVPTLARYRDGWERHQYSEVGDPFVTELADYDLRLITSRPLVIAANGEISGQSPTSFEISAPARRELALSLSPDYQVHETQVGSLLVRGYSADPERSRVYAETAARFADWYGRHFGAYPYDSLSLADAPLEPAWGGMEYPGLIFIAPTILLPSDFQGSFLEGLIAHEVAHQWFYGLVGNDEVRDPWLDEPFAQYLPYYYYHVEQPALFERLFYGRELASLEQRLGQGGNPSLSSSTDDFSDNPPYVVAIYLQGARFLDELRQTIGDAAFEAALADEVRVFGGKIAPPRAVLDLFQRHTTTNLNPLFARYFAYDTVADPSPPDWRIEMPPSPWRSSAHLFIGASIPIGWVEVWLDDRRLYGGPQNDLDLDLGQLEPGEYLLQVRLWDARQVLFERAERVAVSAP
jgi:hypothetical protein